MALILSPREMANVFDIEYKGVTLCLSPDLKLLCHGLYALCALLQDRKSNRNIAQVIGEMGFDSLRGPTASCCPAIMHCWTRRYDTTASLK